MHLGIYVCVHVDKDALGNVQALDVLLAGASMVCAVGPRLTALVAALLGPHRPRSYPSALWTRKVFKTQGRYIDPKY